MKRVLENFKSFILTILIFFSLFLTGSLWFDNYQGLSLHVSSIYNNLVEKLDTDEEFSIIYDKIVAPYKVTVINPDKNKWIYYESDSMNVNAWDITRNRLDSISSGTEIITGKVSEWDGLFNRKSIILEFGGTLDYEVLRLAIPNLPKENPAFYNIEKIGITKSLEGNTIYLLQNNNNKKSLYKVLLKGTDEEIETFMENCEKVKADVRYVDLEKVGTTKFYNNKEVFANTNVIFPIANMQTHKDTVNMIHTNTHFDIENEYEINRFIIDIFDNTDFAKFVTTDESKIFINDDKSSIKFEKNGVVEYINNSKLLGEITSAAKNFNVAMKFINDMRVYNDLYLLSANKENNLYTFKFSVAFNGTIVGLKTPIIDDDMHALIEIQVEEGSVRDFKGKLLDISLMNTSNYISSFTHNILDKVLNNVKENTKINISRLEMMYIVDETGSYYPNWVVRYGERKSEEEFTTLIYTMRKR